MQNLKITLVQADQVWENPQANYANYERLLQSVETDIIVLPEMFQTGFSMNTALAEPFQTSASLQWLLKLSAEKNAACYTSLMIAENGNFYNRGVFVTPEGEVHHYDKRKTFGLAGENAHFERGTKATIVHYKDWKFQLQICYDLRFPEIVRNQFSNQSAAYDVILYVANWPEKRSVHWSALLRARAIENQCFVVGVNRVGNDPSGFLYSGDSALIDALGTESSLTSKLEEVRTFVMNKTELIKIREMLPFLKDA